MKINIFGKSIEYQGKKFPAYTGRLIKKDGTELTVTVKFRQECGGPDLKDCPCQIEFPRQSANLVIKTLRDPEGQPLYNEETGELKTSKTLWIAQWRMVGPYIDHSLDEFEDE